MFSHCHYVWNVGIKEKYQFYLIAGKKTEQRDFHAFLAGHQMAISCRRPLTNTRPTTGQLSPINNGVTMMAASSKPLHKKRILNVWSPAISDGSDNHDSHITENVPKTFSKAPCLVAKRMSPTLHLLLFAQSM